MTNKLVVGIDMEKILKGGIDKDRGKMNSITIYPGDRLAVGNGQIIAADRMVTISSFFPLRRIPDPNVTELQETELRVSDLWSGHNHRVPMEFRHDLRCPCGSVYTRKSATHHSCSSCGRVWTNETVEAAISFEAFSPF